MSEERNNIPAEKASTSSPLKATVVKVIRSSGSSTVGTSEIRSSQASAEAKPAARNANQRYRDDDPKNDLGPIHKVVNQSTRQQFRDFTEHNSRSSYEAPPEKRLARGPHFPMATSLRFASLFYVLGRVAIVASIVALIWFTITDRKDFIIITPVLAIAFLFTFIGWGMSGGLRCRVCTMPFLGKRKCKMNKKAPKLPFLSHQFTCALHILTHNHPRCPYCGTTNRLKQ